MIDEFPNLALALGNLAQAGIAPRSGLQPVLAEGMFLSSVWKPVVLLIPLVLWARVVSIVYDKHAARFFLPRRKWNIFHMSMGLLALGLGLFVGLPIGGEGAFWAGFGAMLFPLGASLLAYMSATKKDARVPEKYKIRLNMPKLGPEKDAAAKAAGKVALTLKGADAKGKFTNLVAPPAAETPEYEVRVAAEKVYQDALRSRASQVDIQPTGKDTTYQFSTLIDGVRSALGEPMPATAAGKIMDFWKQAAGLDVADRRRKLQGLVQVEDGVGKHVVRVTSQAGQGGMRVGLLLDPEQAVTRKPEDLGLLESQFKDLQSITGERKGVVLVVAPPDSGRTTTMYSLLRMHDAYTSNVQTVEVEPQAAVEGVRVNKFDPTAESTKEEGPSMTSIAAAPGAGASAGAEFSTLVRSIIRRDPDVVAVAELPDSQTAKEIAKADHERSRIYLSMKGNDAFSAIQMYVKAVGDGKLAGNSLHGVVAQKMFRKLCGNCKVAYPPTADMLKKLGIPEGKVQQLYKKGGQVLIKNKPEVCPVCNGIGYFGQDACFEVFPLGSEEREMIVAANYQGLKAALRKRGLPTLQQVALRKAVDGITSVEEVLRITAPEGGTPSPASAPAAKPPAQGAAKPAPTKPS
jgi:type II secretory ATPase GspE/PulE/Tfp pilus assembly ATPase PilB-like protein